MYQLVLSSIKQAMISSYTEQGHTLGCIHALRNINIIYADDPLSPLANCVCEKKRVGLNESLFQAATLILNVPRACKREVTDRVEYGENRGGGSSLYLL